MTKVNREISNIFLYLSSNMKIILDDTSSKDDEEKLLNEAIISLSDITNLLNNKLTVVKKKNTSEKNIFKTIYRTNGGKLKWKSGDDINKKHKSSDEKYEYIDNINDIKVPLTKFKSIDDIRDINQSIYFFKGNKKYKKGFYIRLFNSIINIPITNVIEEKNISCKIKSVRCKYGTKEQCSKNKNNNCLYVHKGEKYSRIGTSNRCANLTRFGNFEHLYEDLHIIDHIDIKTMLMGTLNDLLLACIWDEINKLPRGIIYDINIC